MGESSSSTSSIWSQIGRKFTHNTTKKENLLNSTFNNLIVEWLSEGVLAKLETKLIMPIIECDKLEIAKLGIRLAFRPLKKITEAKHWWTYILDPSFSIANMDDSGESWLNNKEWEEQLTKSLPKYISKLSNKMIESAESIVSSIIEELSLLEGTSTVKSQLFLVFETVENELRSDKFIQILKNLSEINKREVKV
ncbi:unnamed protein product [Meloidogyne enterolobii]|uniref:Uncharacterized protein n=1 Tax=Meloidogyne enterolobii TaxID=390850 RepID=A0ACB1ACT8_MELEN